MYLQVLISSDAAKLILKRNLAHLLNFVWHVINHHNIIMIDQNRNNRGETQLQIQKSLCILIVEDEFILGEMLLQTLSSLGYDNTHRSMDYDCAIEKIHLYEPELVLLDIQLGKDYDGLKLAKKLRYSYSIPFIFTTSHSSKEILNKAKVLQPYGYLVKPVKKESLVTAIEIALYKFAYEEVSTQEKEKVLLLDLAHALGRVRQKKDIAKTLSDVLREKLTFDYLGISLWEKNGAGIHRFFDREHLNSGMNGTNRTWSGYHKVKGTAYAKFYSKTDPFVLSLDDSLKPMGKNGPDPDSGNTEGHTGLFVPLIHQTNKLGLLEFHSTHKSHFNSLGKDFLEGITSLVTVAISNLMVTEQLQNRDQERELRIQIGETLITNPTWPTRFEGFAHNLDTLIPSHLISFMLQGQKKGKAWHAYEKVGYNEFRYWSERAMADFLGLDNLLDHLNWKKNNLPHLFVGERFNELRVSNSFYGQIAQNLDMLSVLCLKMKLSGNARLQISLFSKEAATFAEDTGALLNRLLLGNQHVLDKVLVLEEINALNTTLKEEKAYLKHEIRAIGNFDEIIGSSDAISEVFKKVRKVANSDVTVLITGETGTGKELIARAIHSLSDEQDEKPFVKLNCATLPAQLIESELFGHEKGSFTGALEQRIGKFELANGGTIFLDEIGELPVDLQPKLLRVLQEKEFERLGGQRTIQLGVRVLAATNRNLKNEIANGKFRADLYYRLNVFEIEIPPLRARKNDIAQLALYFLDKTSKKMGKHIKGISNASLKELIEHSWPGNVRELEHTIERAVILNQGEILNTKLNTTDLIVGESKFIFKTLEESERELILNTLKHCRGRVRGNGGAAEHLNIHPATLDSRMKKLGISRKHF